MHAMPFRGAMFMPAVGIITITPRHYALLHGYAIAYAIACLISAIRRYADAIDAARRAADVTITLDDAAISLYFH